MESEKEPRRIYESYFEKHKKPILFSVAIISVIIVLVIPIIPIQYTVTETRNRNLRYSSGVYGIYNVPKFVNVTNKDSIGGTFSITMQKWYVNPIGQKQLEDTVTQSAFISAGATHTFYLPEDWIIIQPMYSFTYSVTPPTTQENYNVTKTEYKSIFNLIVESLK
jgi:hypothetical protein